MKKIIFLFLSLATLSGLNGQQSELLLRKKIFIVDSPIIRIDSFSIQKSFFVLKNEKNQTILPQEYEVDYSEALLKLKKYKNYYRQKIIVYYLTYPSFLKKPLFSYTKPQKGKKDSLLLPVIKNDVVYRPKPFEGLKTSGSLTRGVNAGNNQSLVMQSGMELKIEGKLTDKIKLKAVISDDNMPQAYAGISKSYKEFNYIYMKLSGNKWSALGGDFMHNKRPSYFLKFDRKLQGLQFQTGNKSNFSLTGGIVEGEFNRQHFNGIDGNQGPYLLKGKKGEKYIFIIKDSDKVYINGKKLEREKEYKIDYELAEISFAPSIPISSTDRITVEFNYSNQYYLRYLNHNQWKYQSHKGKYEIYTYLERDDKHRSLLFDLDSLAINKLKMAGDNPQQLLIESAKLTPYSPNKILYKKVLTPTESYYEFTTQELPELYEVRFSYMGQNKGNYKIEKVTAIGKIYTYTGPNNGDYSPVVKLVAPESHQYTGFKWDQIWGENTHISSDIILSQSDNNLFSKKDDKDNIGIGANLKFTHWLQKDSIKKWSIYGNYRFLHKNFQAMDPYENPEFTYQWQIDSLFGKQNFIKLGSHFNTEKLQFDTGADYLSLRDKLKAYRIFARGTKIYKKLRWQGENSFLNQLFSGGHLYKTKLDNEIAFQFKKGIWSNRIYIEKRKMEKDQILDSLNFGYKFLESKWIVNENLKNEFQVGIKLEQSDSILQTNYTNARRSWMFFLQKKYTYKNGRISFYNRWQQLKSRTTSNKSFYNFSLLWNQQWAHKSVVSDLQLETYNGNILQDEMIFVETPPGQGIYQWNDYNQNGIKEINEFEIATFSDQARFIKVLLPSKKTLPVNNNLYSLKIIFNPKKANKLSFLNKIYNRLQLKTSHQTPLINKQVFFEWNPKNSLLKNTYIQNDFYFNRTKKKYRFHFSYQNIQNEQWLIVGRQALANESWKVETSHLFEEQIIWRQSFSSSRIKQFSENYAAKNFSLDQLELEQELSLYKKKKSQGKLFYQWKKKKSLKGDGLLKMNSLGINYLSYFTPKYSFYAQIKFIYNDYTGNPYTPVAFYMLEGLQQGKNLLTELNYKKKISSYLEMLLQYQFRISEEHKGIHTAGLQLRMTF